ncbi:hypothetical protein SFRURICE_001767 [Spodoptera frugiperda]|nr:hypothetical protein SFRURICE_001767 [Spodoptera frugiperda]
MAPCGALCVPPCISDMDTLMETRECRAGPLTAAIQPLSGEPSPQTHHTVNLTASTLRLITSLCLPVDTRQYHRESHCVIQHIYVASTKYPLQ